VLKVRPDETLIDGQHRLKILTVEYILTLLAHGATVAEILAEYHGRTQEDIQACLLFAARALEDTSFMPLVTERT
jgi:hypothetical protein